MENLYGQTSRLLAGTQQLLQCLLTKPEKSQEALVTGNLEQLHQDVYRLETMARKEVPSRRQEAHMRVEQLKVEVQTMQRAFQSYQRRISEAEQAAAQREELLMRRYTPNSGGDTSISLDHAVHHNQRLMDANTHLDSLLSHGGNVQESLKSQSFTLKSAHRKLLDLTNTLGLSNTVMRLIEKRSAQDAWIFWTGLVVSSIIIFLLIYYYIL